AFRRGGRHVNGVSTLWVLTTLAGLIGVLIVWLQRHPEEMRRLMKTFGEKGLMNAQYDPHTPLWRRILSLPHTRLGWWAVGLAAPALVFMVLTNVLAIPNTDTPQLEILGLSVPQWGQDVLIPIVFFGWLVSALVGGVVGFIAVARDRSLLLLIAQVPGLIIFAFFVWIGVSMMVGGEADVRVSFPIAFLLWAVANFLMSISGTSSGPWTKL
ncbi:MAG TPA: hypothetical protein VFI90_04265, partial [Rubrobacter sp.]|nr:hypothetical protein [Rubrobacter sp.]